MTEGYDTRGIHDGIRQNRWRSGVPDRPPMFLRLCQLLSFVHYTIVEFGKLCIVPAVGRADEVSCDTLKPVDVLASAFGTCRQAVLRILVAAVHAPVAVVVDGAIADIITVHHIHDIGYRLGIVRGVAVDLHVEDMTAAGQFMIRSFDLGLVAWRASVVDGYVIGVGVVDLVSHAGYYAEAFAVL